MSDLISREALIEEIKQRAGMWQKTAEKFIAVIKEQPTVEAKEVVHGEWINGCCSNCGAYIATDSRIDYIDEKDCNFCYSCGADMRKKV